MQRDVKEMDTQFTSNVYFWTPNSEILAKALSEGHFHCNLYYIQRKKQQHTHTHTHTKKNWTHACKRGILFRGWCAMYVPQKGCQKHEQNWE